MFSILEDILHIEKTYVNNNHDNYTLIHHTDAVNFRTGSSVGIYKDINGKKYFIKDYAYTLRNLEYEYLHNEINTLKVFKTKSLPQLKVRTARLVAANDTNNRITVITKYAEGKTLDHFTKITIQNTLIDVLSFFAKTSLTISKPVLSTIPKRTQILTYITFPFYFIRGITKDPTQMKLFLKSASLFLKFAPQSIFESVPYGICHRDLSVDNILYDPRSKYTTVLDTECTVLCDKLYDAALLPRLFIQYLNASQFFLIFQSLHLTHSEIKRLIVLMIAGCIIKIATEKKNSRDYDNATLGLSLVVTKLIPQIIKTL